MTSMLLKNAISNPTDADRNHPAYLSLASILDAIDALVYVTDMSSHEIIFMNQYGKNIWGDATGKKCWSALQDNQDGPCSFCTNHQLVNAEGVPSGVVVWEFQNTVNGRWYQCRDQAIPWLNGKLARIEIATDITDLKNSVLAMKEAKKMAEELSRTDELTGAKNRRAVKDEAQLLFNLARRYETHIAIVMLDMDHFKQINDRYGHVTGDQVLKSVATHIQANIREVDVFGRYGGEEFVLILPGMTLDNAAKAMERLRQCVAELRFDGPHDRFQATCSMGISAYDIRHTSFEDAIKDADLALYRAKAAGRNRVMVHEETTQRHQDN